MKTWDEIKKNIKSLTEEDIREADEFVQEVVSEKTKNEVILGISTLDIKPDSVILVKVDTSKIDTEYLTQIRRKIKEDLKIANKVILLIDGLDIEVKEEGKI